ncbi:MAG: hypothetical protein AAGF11_40785 [Myxococcota bacterium]
MNQWHSPSKSLDSPLSLPEHGYHAPNERFDWKQAKVGMIAFTRVFEQLAA